MTEDMRFPTWRDVGIPTQFVETIKNLQGDNLLEQLIYEKVFRKTRRMQYVYVCGVCGHQHKPEKNVEDYRTCEICNGKAITVTQHLRGWNRKHPTGCSNTDAFAQDVLVSMRVNYSRYFSKYLEEIQSEDIVVFRWKQECGFVAGYLGGDQVEGPSTAKALCKASLLVPFLWDDNFNWESKKKMPPGRQSLIFPTLYEWVQRSCH